MRSLAHRRYRRARFLARLAARVAAGKLGRPRPFFLSHLVTGRCNFSCPQCLWKDNLADDMTGEEIARLYRQARDCGFIASYLWGGEPLQRRDAGAILRASWQSALFTLVNTNAWFLSEKLDEIVDHVDLFVLSLDHPRAEVHDAHRGVPGSHARVLAAIELLGRHPGATPIVNTLILRQNRDHLDEMLDLWRRLGVRGYMNFIERDLLHAGPDGPHRDATRNCGADVSPAEKRAIAAHLKRRQAEGAPLLNSRDYFSHFLDAQPRRYACHFPKIFLELRADGSVIDCTQVDRPIGNLRRQPLAEVLEHARVAGMIADGERWCSVHDNADRIDTSLLWELRPGALAMLARLAWGSA